MRFFNFLFLLLMVSCKPVEKELTAQQIIDKSILASGTDKVVNSKISFIFRDRNYIATRRNGIYQLRRFELIKDSTITEDVLRNDGFKRLVNTKAVELIDSMKVKYSNSVNSVHYFSVLPYGLNDKAVHKKLLSSSTIKGRDYYKIEITFSEDGGGEDFEDVFIYWISKSDFLIDYLAYSYHTNGGGKRFRVLKEQCTIQGIRFVDYHNYKPKNNGIELINLDQAFENNELEKVSEIVLEDIEVDVFE